MILLSELATDPKAAAKPETVLPELLVSALNMPAAVFDRQGMIRHLNRRWAGLISIPASTAHQLVDLRDRTTMVSILAELPQGSEVIQREMRLANGRWAAVSVQALDTPDAAPLWMAVATDIHATKADTDAVVEQSIIQERLLNICSDCIKLIDPYGKVIFMNEAGCKALGVDPHGKFGMDWIKLLPKEVHAVCEEALEQVRSGEIARFAGASHMPDGSLDIWDNMLTPLQADDGTVTAILCVSRNVSEQRKTADALRDSQERLAMATRVGGLGIWDLDVVSGHLFCDDTWYEILGRSPSEPIHSLEQFKPLIHPDDRERASEVDITARTLVRDGKDYIQTFRIIRPDGEVRHVRSAASLITNTAGQPVRAVGLIQDITDALRGQEYLQQANRELEQQAARLEQQSLEDPMTGLPNRRALSTELQRMIQQARRNDTPLCVAMIDLDYFKQYNDSYGHLEGDIALSRFAVVLKDLTRRGDFSGRYGGEEFVMILNGTDDPQPALDRLFEAVAYLQIKHEHSPYGTATISCGCAIFQPGESMTPNSMVERADKALYQAKQEGRNRYVIDAG